MRTLEFMGHSDDTFGWELFAGGKAGGPAYGSHDDCANGTVRAFRVASASTGTAVIVIGAYSKAPAAVWAIGIAPDEEDVAIPVWATSPRFRTVGYTPVLSLDVPDDTTVHLVCIDGRDPSR